MVQSDDFDRTVELCIEACQAVLEHGTPEMVLPARILLSILGRELADRLEQAETADDTPPSG